MPNTRWRKVWADLTANRGRSLLVVFSIAVGVLAVGIILGANQVLSREMERGYAASLPPQTTLYCSPFDDDMLHIVESMPEIAAASGRATYMVRAKLGDDRYQDLMLSALDHPHAQGLKRVEPVEGVWPPTRNDLIVERLSIETLEASVGDTLVIESPAGLTREMTVVGTAKDVSQVAPRFQWYTAAYVDPQTMGWLGLPEGYNELSIVLTKTDPTRAQVTAAAERVQAKLEKAGMSVQGYWVPPVGQHPMQEILQPVFAILSILGVLALGLAGFLVLNTVSAVLCQESANIGMMKAIGARRIQVVGIYLALVACYGVIGMAVGIPLAAAGAKLFVDYLGALMNVDVASYWAPWWVYAVQIAAGLLTPIVAALLPVLKATKVTVREAVQNYGLSQGLRLGALDRLLLRMRWLPRPFLLSMRNTFRHKGRLLLTLATFTMAGAILVAVVSVRASMMATLDDAFEYFDYDISVGLTQYERSAEVEALFNTLPGVAATECWASAGAERVLPEGGLSKGFKMFAVQPNTSMIRPTIHSGRWLLPEDENAIVVNTYCLRDDPGLAVGSTVTIQQDRRGHTVEQEWVVVGLAKGVMTGPIAYANDGYFTQRMGRPGQSRDVRLRLTDRSAEGQRVVAEQLQDLVDSHGIEVSTIQMQAQERELIVGQVDLLVGTLVFMSVLFALVGGFGVMGTMGINVLERTHEIGVMRAVGATDRAVLGIVVAEGAVIGLLGWVAGLIVSLPLARVLTDIVGQAVLDSTMTHVYSFTGVVLWLLLAVSLAGLASLVPAKRAASLAVRDTLAYQ